MWRVLCVLAATAIVSISQAKIVTQTVEYRHGETTLKGYLAYDDALSGKRPGVLVVHEWWGLNEFAKQRAERLAELGYVAFAVDMYGDGMVTRDPEKAGQLAGPFRQDPTRCRARARAGLDVLAKDERCDARRIAAIGYCFGGSTVLQLAYDGAPLAGVVSFHGNPMPPRAEDKIVAKILVLHGADDPLVSAESISAFQQGMTTAGVDWQMVYYGRAVHSFTNPEADKVGIAGVAYDEAADRRSWQAMQQFFEELFAAGKK